VVCCFHRLPALEGLVWACILHDTRVFFGSVSMMLNAWCGLSPCQIASQFVQRTKPLITMFLAGRPGQLLVASFTEPTSILLKSAREGSNQLLTLKAIHSIPKTGGVQDVCPRIPPRRIYSFVAFFYGCRSPPSSPNSAKRATIRWRT